jgi:hypothetical protein
MLITPTAPKGQPGLAAALRTGVSQNKVRNKAVSKTWWTLGKTA